MKRYFFAFSLTFWKYSSHVCGQIDKRHFKNSSQIFFGFSHWGLLAIEWVRSNPLIHSNQPPSTHHHFPFSNKQHNFFYGQWSWWCDYIIRISYFFQEKGNPLNHCQCCWWWCCYQIVKRYLFANKKKSLALHCRY